ncbi:MAG: hypothetical protein ABI891_04765 [Acidobacteriota bacterium]
MKKANLFLILTLFILGISGVSAQNKKDESVKSIGGEEHESNIYGVKIGMDIPTALQAVFVNANRQPGQEKPDAMKKEGAGDKDVRVLYKNLPKGDLQIIFADGKYVREVVLSYKEKKGIDDLRLASSGDIGAASAGQRYDDRYTIGFVNSKKQEKLWWRDEKTSDDYEIRVSFLSGNILKDGTLWWQIIVQKDISVKPGDEKKFAKAVKGEK